MNQKAPEVFRTLLETSKGRIVIEVTRDWAPYGADRFYNLVRAGYFDQGRFFRVIGGKWAQFGIHGDPAVSRLWQGRRIADDAHRVSNVRGTIAYAFAVPNGRTTQVFINLRDNSATHDAEPFVPFGRVVEGMDVADALNAEYGEQAGGGIRGSKQGPLFSEGNAYLERNFPSLDYIKSATVLELAKEPTTNVVQSENFRITWDDQGVTGLADPFDPFGAQMLATGQRLSAIVRGRNAGEQPAERYVQPKLTSSFQSGKLSYQSRIWNPPVRLTQTFQTNGNALDWLLDLEPAGEAPVEIGDLAISIPVTGPRGEDPKQIFERGFLKHQFISGNGSFLYFVRASGAPPFLMVTVLPGTKLEYFAGGGGGRGSAQVFVHSAITGNNETHGTWRQAHTSLTLDPADANRGRAHYGFRFRWASSYEEMRQILYEEGLFDIRVVPGMVVPEDLTARFALHTRARIDSIEPEFPAKTKITPLEPPDSIEAGAGKRLTDYRRYEVAFQRLGENRLTIHHDGGRTTFLEFFVTEPLETLVKKRAAFIVNRQQIRDPAKWWDGVFGPYDMKKEVVRTIDDPDIFTGRMVYVLTCDDPGLCKAPFVAEKNVSFPNLKEIEGIEYYLQHFVWGKLQRTDAERPYPYGVYGTPEWYTNRDPGRRAKATNQNLDKMHVWRSYDYPHMVMLYFHLYEIAAKYPRLSKYLDAAGYLERAYQTARAFFTYPYEIFPSYYETYKWGLYNELVVLKLADALDREGFRDRAAWLRAEWEKKVKYFVYDDPYPFRSEYAFDRTAFESSYALAKYGATHDMKPDTNLWFDVKRQKWYSHPRVTRDDSRAFMERQLAAGLCVRGWLEASYYQLGADGGLSYMAAMGGWGILDYAENFAPKPFDWLQLGYASYLSSWCLVNSGPPESHYGFWFPGKENDGAAGWQFMSAKYGRAWMGAQVPRGPWPYDGEIDLGFGGALRMAATILTRDPIFGWIAYGGTLKTEPHSRPASGSAKGASSVTSLSIIPRDGLRQRFYALVGDAKTSAAPLRRLKLELDRDGFSAGQPILVDSAIERISFTMENRTEDAHTTTLSLALPEGEMFNLAQDGRSILLRAAAEWDFPLRAEIQVKGKSTRIELVRTKLK